jgi:hypothetical protein
MDLWPRQNVAVVTGQAAEIALPALEFAANLGVAFDVR